METHDYQYLLCIQEHGIEEVVFHSPERMACFLLVIADSFIRKFGATNEK